jgi:hypothetical protein
VRRRELKKKPHQNESTIQANKQKYEILENQTKDRVKSLIQNEHSTNLVPKKGLDALFERFRVPKNVQKKWQIKPILEAYTRVFVYRMVHNSFQDIWINNKKSLNETTVLATLSFNGFPC